MDNTTTTADGIAHGDNNGNADRTYRNIGEDGTPDANIGAGAGGTYQMTRPT